MGLRRLNHVPWTIWRNIRYSKSKVLPLCLLVSAIVYLYVSSQQNIKDIRHVIRLRHEAERLSSLANQIKGRPFETVHLSRNSADRQPGGVHLNNQAKLSNPDNPASILRIDSVRHHPAKDGSVKTGKSQPATQDKKDCVACESAAKFYDSLNNNEISNQQRDKINVSQSRHRKSNSAEHALRGGYNRTASPTQYDNLIKVVMDTKDGCGVPGTFDILMAVHTAPTHFAHRQAYRWLYGDASKTEPWRIKLVFFIGLVSNSTLQDQLVKENQDFGDLVQGSFYDAYVNMTYKAVMVYDWLDRKCQNLSAYLYRVDDDVFIDVDRITRRWRYVLSTQKNQTIMCQRLNNDRILRKGKWAVPESLVPGVKYRFMRCPGYFVAVSDDMISKIVEQVKRVPYFWIDDIIVYGIVPSLIGNVRIYTIRKWMAKPKLPSEDLINCYREQGSKCEYWVGIVQDPAELKLLYQYSHKKH